MGRGAKASLWNFSDAQKSAIDSHITSFEEQVRQLNPDWKAHQKELTKAKQEIAGPLLDSDLFRPLWDEKHTDYVSEDESAADSEKEREVIRRRKEGGRKGWLEAIMCRFTNHANNKMKPRDLKAISLAAATTPSEGCPIPSKSFFNFDISGKSLFILENEAEITTLYKKISEQDNIPAGGARNKAIKKLWHKANQEEWNAKAEVVANDVPKNQREFPTAIYLAMKQLAETGHLGSTLISFSYVFRDSNNDGIISGISYVGYNAQTRTQINAKPHDSKMVHELWAKHADATLLRKPVMVHLERNGSGMPIFPDVDLTTSAPPMVVETLKSYVTELWVSSWPFEAEMPSVPWADISTSPDTYYDIKAFVLLCPLVAPQTLTLPNLYILAPFFIQSSSSPNPFHFRSKSEILERISASEEQAHDKGHPAELGVEGTAPQLISSTGSGAAGHERDGGEDDTGNEGGGEDVGNEGVDGSVDEGNMCVGGNNGGIAKTANLGVARAVLDPSMATMSNDVTVLAEHEVGVIPKPRQSYPQARKTRGGRKGHGGKNAGQSASLQIMNATSPVTTTSPTHPPEPSTSPAVIIGPSTPIISISNPSGHTDSRSATGSVSAPAGTAPTIAVRPSCKRKAPNAFPTLIAAKVPAVVGPDGCPLKKKPGYDYVPVTD